MSPAFAEQQRLQQTQKQKQDEQESAKPVASPYLNSRKSSEAAMAARSRALTGTVSPKPRLMNTNKNATNAAASRKNKDLLVSRNSSLTTQTQRLQHYPKAASER